MREETPDGPSGVPSVWGLAEGSLGVGVDEVWGDSSMHGMGTGWVPEEEDISSRERLEPGPNTASAICRARRLCTSSRLSTV